MFGPTGVWCPTDAPDTLLREVAGVTLPESANSDERRELPGVLVALDAVDDMARYNDGG